VADYLTRLVERSLGLYPTVRPDLPPTFAPAKHDLSLAEPAEREQYSLPGGVPTSQTGNPSQGPESAARHEGTSRPDERYDPLVQQGEEDGPVFREPDDVASSTAGGPARRTGALFAKISRSFVSKTAGERRTAEPQATGEKREGDESPDVHGEGRPASPPGAVGQSRWEPDGPREVPDASSFERPAKTIRDDYDVSSGPPTGPSGMSTSPAKSPIDGTLSMQGERLRVDHDEVAAERGGTDAAASSLRREAESSGASSQRPPANAEDSDRGERPDLVRETTRDRPFSQVAGREERDRAPDPSVSLTGPQGPVPRPQTVTPPQGRTKERSSPTVRVTIGRVEVRAIPPQPVVQPPPETRPEPALSLEDYLRQRGGVRR
jgi:hypothetical protein